MNPVASARQDAWLAYIIAWSGGLLLVGVYILISKLHADKTLIEILQVVFGKYIGGLLGLLYVLYFIHLAVLVLRNFTEFSVITLYPETPRLFIAFAFIIPTVYILLNGFEILARLSELLVPLLPLLVVFLFIILIPRYDFGNFFPLLKKGVSPVLRSAFAALTFPFGESVVFLMVFPLLVEKNKLTKTVYSSFIITGLMLLSITVRDLMVLGPTMFAGSTFPPMISTRLIPNLDITLDAVIGLNLMIGGGIKITVCLYAAIRGFSQLFNFNNYQRFVMPIIVVVVGLSVVIYDSVFEMMSWAANVYPTYVIPFQIVIPCLILIFSWVKRWRTSS